LVVEAKETQESTKLSEDIFESLFDSAKKHDKPVILAVNKIDLFKEKSSVLPVLQKWGEKRPFDAIIPSSATVACGLGCLRMWRRS
jgi:GTP-binding protein Era